MNKFERQLDLLKVITKLDISPSMYRNADEKYHSIATYLENHGIIADMYPQGSFALGTVTRPYVKGKDAGYDLDFICQVQGSKEEIHPKELRDNIQRVLEESDLYGGKLTVYDECFTIEYADIGNVSFKIDIVPATGESYEEIQCLKNMCSRPDLVDTAIAIPRNSHQRVYNWITNNPKGYREWFSEINKPFRQFSGTKYRRNLFEECRQIFSSIEEIPEGLERTSMQQVIQLLKYHRDVYYSRVSSGEELKPISAIINTIVAKISQNADPRWSTFELLDYVLREFDVYSNLQNMTQEVFRKKYLNKSVFSKDLNGKWIIINPANPKDNLANKWNINPEIPKRFFLWVKTAKMQLIDALELSDMEFRANAETALGKHNVETVWGKKYNSDPPKPFIENPAKPWRER